MSERKPTQVTDVSCFGLRGFPSEERRIHRERIGRTRRGAADLSGELDLLPATSLLLSHPDPEARVFLGESKPPRPEMGRRQSILRQVDTDTEGALRRFRDGMGKGTSEESLLREDRRTTHPGPGRFGMSCTRLLVCLLSSNAPETRTLCRQKSRGVRLVPGGGSELYDDYVLIKYFFTVQV